MILIVIDKVILEIHLAKLCDLSYSFFLCISLWELTFSFWVGVV